MRTMVIDNKEITFNGYKARATWTDETVEELKKFHDVDVTEEITLALIQELDNEFTLSEEEKVICKEQLLEHLKARENITETKLAKALSEMEKLTGDFVKNGTIENADEYSESLGNLSITIIDEFAKFADQVNKLIKDERDEK